MLTMKANYFAEHFGWDVTIVLTEGKGKPLFYPLSPKIKVVNLDVNFEELWTCSFARKIIVYLKKQRRFKKLLSAELMRLQADITVSLLRREINFITQIPDGSKKIGELHINRANYRNFNTEDAGMVKRLFARAWSHSLLSHLRQLEKLVVLTERDREAWTELDNVVAIPDALPFTPSSVSTLTAKRVLAIARYSHEKGIDMLLQAWTEAEKRVAGWWLDVYGDGDRSPYEQQMAALGIEHCRLHGRTDNVEREYLDSSIFVLSSRFEGFGMVIIEAMACGLPVVAFDCPWGPQSIIKNGEDGLLVENGDIHALAEGMVRLMSDEGLCRAMSASGLKNVRRFGIERIADQWRQLFEEIVKIEN